jgi:CubicO group peptidase (beta-lactamase class C family)
MVQLHGLSRWQGLVGILGLLVAGCGTPDRDTPLSSPLALHVPVETLSIDLSRFIPEQLNQAGVPGLSIAIVRNGQVVWTDGFGVTNVLTREPLRADTVFEVASISKVVTAYTALRLVGQGKLVLDAPLNRYLVIPFLPQSPWREVITLRHVLTHTSGLPNLLVGAYLVLLQDRFWGNVVSCFVCDIPQYLSGS